MNTIVGERLGRRCRAAASRMEQDGRRLLSPEVYLGTSRGSERSPAVQFMGRVGVARILQGIAPVIETIVDLCHQSTWPRATRI